MKIKPEMLTLYAVTDRRWLNGRQLADVIRELILGGVTLVQLREKDLPAGAFIEEAKKVKAVTDAYGIPLIINDNIEVCMAVDAAGVHIGQSDMAAGQVRSLLGQEKIIGVTAKTIEQARFAQQCGADYLGSGAVFGSATKLDTSAMSLETLDQICESVDIPVVAIGGIDENNISRLNGHKMAGAAVVSALFKSTEPQKAAAHLLTLAQKAAGYLPGK